MRKTTSWLALPAAAMLLAACQATQTSTQFECIKATSGNYQIRAVSTGYALEISDFSIEPNDGVQLCDVTMQVMADSNGNSIPGDKGDKKEDLKGPGLGKGNRFMGWSRRNFRFDVPSSASTGYLVVWGRKCDETTIHVLGTFRFTQWGIMPGNKGPAPDDNVTIGGSGPSPHFITVERLATRPAIVRVGGHDLSRAPGDLRWLYLEGGREPPSDFLGLVILVGSQFIGFVPASNGRAWIDLPVPTGVGSDLQVVTLNSSLAIVASWRAGGLN